MSDERLAEIREYAERVKYPSPPYTVIELLAEVEALRAPAQLGSALVDALRGVEALDPNDALVLFRDRYGVWRSGVSEDVAVCLTDATVAFDASLLAAFPQEDSRG